METQQAFVNSYPRENLVIYRKCWLCGNDKPGQVEVVKSSAGAYERCVAIPCPVWTATWRLSKGAC
jgi:hypothetical protein